VVREASRRPQLDRCQRVTSGPRSRWFSFAAKARNPRLGPFPRIERYSRAVGGASLRSMSGRPSRRQSISITACSHHPHSCGRPGAGRTKLATGAEERQERGGRWSRRDRGKGRAKDEPGEARKAGKEGSGQRASAFPPEVLCCQGWHSRLGVIAAKTTRPSHAHARPEGAPCHSATLLPWAPKRFVRWEKKASRCRPRPISRRGGGPRVAHPWPGGPGVAAKSLSLPQRKTSPNAEFALPFPLSFFSLLTPADLPGARNWVRRVPPPPGRPCPPEIAFLRTCGLLQALSN